jgi:molybdenum cofactor cytidylyltransferase
MTTAAVLLAAGAGSRFTGPAPKLLAPFRGRAVVDWAIAAAVGAGLDDVFVVCGSVPVDPPVGVTRIDNPRWQDGIATSLGAGVDAARAAGHDAVVVGLADQPLVVAEAWRLVAAAVATPLAVATYAGTQGHPVRLARVVWDDLPTTGDEGARRLLRGRPELVTAVPCPGSGADIDTVEDLRRWS